MTLPPHAAEGILKPDASSAHRNPGATRSPASNRPSVFVLITFGALVGCLLLGIGCDVSNRDGVRPKASIDAFGLPALERCQPSGDAYDFVLQSATARSNAIANDFQPPPGWVVLCNNSGLFRPKFEPSGVIIQDESVVRTNRQQAVIACYRIQEIWDSPLPSSAPLRTNEWTLCN